jgi:MFS family permease
MSSIWGHLFDRMNFFVLRIVLNLCFAVGIFSFFTGEGWAGLIEGALIFGVANAGGDVAWSLWVTKMAPADHVAEYMSVHTFLTGVRGVAAPLLAFQAAQIYALSTLAWVCAGMILVATVMLLPEIRAVRERKGTPLVEEGVE